MGTCFKASTRFTDRSTVADAVTRARSQESAVESAEPDDLALYAYGKFLARGGRRLRLNWAMDTKYLSAMEHIIQVCAASKWPPKKYIDAQIDALTPAIERGWKLQPGHFLGEKANARFERWVSSYEAKYGDAKVSRLDAKTKDAESRLAAATAYGRARLANGVTYAEALTEARRFHDEWLPQDATDRERIEALNVALLTIDPLLPHLVLLPAERWTWKQAREMLETVQQTDDGEGDGSEPVLSASLGDFV
jgi:hypothetical protein